MFHEIWCRGEAYWSYLREPEKAVDWFILCIVNTENALLYHPKLTNSWGGRKVAATRKGKLYSHVPSDFNNIGEFVLFVRGKNNDLMVVSIFGYKSLSKIICDYWWNHDAVTRSPVFNQFRQFITDDIKRIVQYITPCTEPFSA